MNRRIRVTLLAFLVAAAVPALTQASTWQFDPSHSAASFVVRHLMISNVRGEMHGLAGTAEWDDKDPATLKIEVSIDASTIDTREEKRDAHLKSPDFLDVAKNPKLTFKSKSAASAGPNKFKVTGDLTIHGVTKETVFDVETTPPVKTPWGDRRIGAVATAKIDRSNFGLNWNKALETGGVLVGDEVAITIDAELTEKAAAGAGGEKKK